MTRYLTARIIVTLVGIAVWGDRLFLTTFDVYRDGDPKFSGTILGHCLDAHTTFVIASACDFIECCCEGKGHGTGC